jgi:DNA-directed RNA polymerase specialized sigma24 family protein
MEQRKHKRREVSAVPTPVDQLLASRYSQLSQWGTVLTCGDAGRTEEIVQELCLYFTLTQPDLTSVANLDGYLYTSLRHIYLSGLARSSREALQFVSVAEFDSFDSALAGNCSADPLQKQNDLRRICGYTVWRKESSKSASYFILHFFHGYSRREIAALACLPISAIYNKLKIARSEVMSHLEEPGKLRVVNRDTPPQPTLSWSLLSAFELFNELRNTILRARVSDCLNEGQLLAHYRAAAPKPISCSLLAHLVSCERCLSIVDRHFRRPTLKDREPLDCFGTSAEGSNGSADGSWSLSQKAQTETLQAVRRRWGKIHEHRPRTLSIAVNGHIIAFHDVRAEHSKLSARIEHPEQAKFVEVFSEQDVRFALLSIGELPPGGAPVRIQRVDLSDDRWLELSLAFDGQGLNGEVTYFDPALASQAIEEGLEESPEWESDSARQTRPSGLRLSGFVAAFRRLLAGMAPSPAFAGMLILAALLGAAGYLAYRHPATPTVATKILDESIKTEEKALRGQTEHQLLHVEEVSASGKVLEQGTVDLWKDGNGDRYLRRLYDSQHRMLAAEWRNKSGEHSSRRNPATKSSPGDNHPAAMSEFWDQDLSAHAFSTLAGQDFRMHAVKEGYELMTDGPIEGHPQLVSAALVLNRRLQPVRATLRVLAGSNVHELRFVQASYERRPSASVPDTMFDPASYSGTHELHPLGIHPPNMPVAEGTVPLLAELQIAVLYQLNRLGADTGEPLEVKRTDDGYIQVSGAIADDTLKQKIASQLRALPNHRFLDLKLFSPHELRIHGTHAPQSPATRVYEIDQANSAADATLRKHFQAKGLSGEQLDSAVVTFSHDALEHAQRALQDAYALDRLGRALSASELRSVSLMSQQQWTEMLHQHASALKEQLSAIRAQLGNLSASPAALPDTDPGAVPIENPQQFSRAAGQLLQQVQDLNRRVSNVFASGTSGEDQTTQGDFVTAIVKAIPLQEAREIGSFARQLSSSATPPVMLRPNHGDGQQSSDKPR